jgi:hypothetical protein
MTKEELYNMQQLLTKRLNTITSLLKYHESLIDENSSGFLSELSFEEEYINQCIYKYLLVKIQEDLERIENGS